MTTDLSAIFANIGSAAAQAAQSDSSAAKGKAVYIDSATYYTQKSANSGVTDQDMYDQWANGLISDDEWLAYIAQRVNETQGNPKEHLKWVKYQRKYSVSISDNKMQYAYEQGNLSLDDYIAYQRKSLDGVDPNSQEYRDRNTALQKMVEQRSASDIALRAQNTLSLVKQGKKSWDDLLGVYREGLKSAKPGTDWYNKLQSAIADTEQNKTADAFNGGAEEIQYLFESGKITGAEAGRRLRGLADQYIKGDKTNYYKTLQAALQYEQAGGRGGGGGGGGGGGTRKQTKTSIGDAYLAQHTRALDKLNAAIKNASTGVAYNAGYMQKLRTDAIASIDAASSFIAKNGTKEQLSALNTARKGILADVQSQNTLDVQTKLGITLAIGKAKIREAAVTPKADAGADTVAAVAELYQNLDNIAMGLPVDEQGNKRDNYVNPQVGFTQMAPDTAIPNAAWLSEVYGARDALGVILNKYQAGVPLTDADVKQINDTIGKAKFKLGGKSADYSVVDTGENDPDFVSWSDMINFAALAVKDNLTVQSGSGILIKRADGSYGTVETQSVPGPIGGSGGGAPTSRIDPAKAGIAEGNILVGMLEPGADGNATMVYVEASPATTTFGGLGQTLTANTTIPLVGKDGKPLKNPETGKQIVVKQGEMIDPSVWEQLGQEQQQNLLNGEVVTQSNEVRLAGWYQYAGQGGEQFIVNRVTGQTVSLGQEGQEVYPFTHTDNVNGMGIAGMVNPSLAPDARVVPIAASGLTAAQVNEWATATDPTGGVAMNAGALTGTTFIDPSTGRSATVPHNDPRVATYYADQQAYEQAQASGLGSRLGEYANGGRGSESPTVNALGFTVGGTDAGGWSQPKAATPEMAAMAESLNIRGLTNAEAFNFAPSVAALMGNPQPTLPTPLVAAKSRQFSGPAMTGRNPQAEAPTIKPAFTEDRVASREEKQSNWLATPLSTALSAPTAKKIVAPVATGKSPDLAPPPAAPKVTPPKPKKAKVGGGSAGVKNRTVAS